jgi:hypothetical protein
MSSARPVTQGVTRTCPHCKATILESAAVCPGCRHHLRFGTDAQRSTPFRSAWSVEGTLAPPSATEMSEYCIVIVVRNERNEETARHVVNVGALQGNDRRAFTLSVEVSPPQPMRPMRRG